MENFNGVFAFLRRPSFTYEFIYIEFRTSTGGNRYLSDYPGSGASMQHLACFAGGMIAYGSKDSLTPEEDLKVHK